jgi:hypothetical protein
VDWLVQANVSQKRAVSIFRAEVMNRDSEGGRRVKSEGKGQSGRVRQRLSWTDDETPSRRQKMGE